METFKNIFLTVTIAFTFVFCDSSQEITLDDNNAYLSNISPSSMLVNEGEIVSESEILDLDVYRRNVNSSDKNQIQPKVIKQGNISFETSDLEKTTQRVYQAVKNHNAQIQSDREGKNYQQSHYKNIVIRVDNDKFESLIKEISQFVNYFDTKEVASQDVTERYIDIQSRLKTKKELESRYLELLKKATQIAEMIEIEKNLSKIREEIEAKEGQLNYLQNQVASSTIQIYFYKKTSDTGITNSYGSKITNAVKHGFDRTASLFITFIEYWHFITFFIICYWYYNKRKKKKQNKKDEIPT